MSKYKAQSDFKSEDIKNEFVVEILTYYEADEKLYYAISLSLEDYELSGDLTIGRTTKAIVMETEFMGKEKGRFNDTRAGFEVTGKINRKDYGLTWNVLTDAGSFVVGEDVKLNFDIQIVKE